MTERDPMKKILLLSVGCIAMTIAGITHHRTVAGDGLRAEHEFAAFVRVIAA